MKERVFLLKTSWLEVFDRLNNRQLGKLTRAVFRYLNGNTDEGRLLGLSNDVFVIEAFRFIIADMEVSAGGSAPSATDCQLPAIDYELPAADFSERMELLRILAVEKGVDDADAELDRFLRYYDARGWLDGKGAPIRNKAALLRFWRIY